MKKNKLILFLLSLVVALALWLYVVTVISPESEKTLYNVPVVLEGKGGLEQRYLMLSDESLPTVTLKLAGNRVDLNKINESNVTVTVDLAQIEEEGEHNLTYDVTMPGNVANDAISVLTRNPGRVNVKAVRFAKKDLDVTVQFQGQDPDDHVVLDGEEEVECSEKITVSGPATVVDKLSMLQITVDKTGLTTNLSTTVTAETLKTSSQEGNLRFAFLDKEGNAVALEELEKLNVLTQELDFAVNVHRVVELTLYLELQAGGGANSGNTSYTINGVEDYKIRVHGDEEALKELPKDLRWRVDTVKLGELQQNLADESFVLTLPSGITNMTMTGSNEVLVDLVLPELDVRKLDIETADIRKDNLPDNLNLTYMTGRITITLRGPQALLDRLDAKDITVILNAEGLSAGKNQRIKLNFELSSEYSSLLGPVGTYEVYVDITEKG